MKTLNDLIWDVRDLADGLPDPVRKQLWDLCHKYVNTESDLERYIQELEGRILMIDEVVSDLRTLLPGEKKPDGFLTILETFAERAVLDIGTLMAACIDYRNLLIRASVPDSISGRHEGVERILNKYGVVIEQRPMYGYGNLLNASRRAN